MPIAIKICDRCRVETYAQRDGEPCQFCAEGIMRAAKPEAHTQGVPTQSDAIQAVAEGEPAVKIDRPDRKGPTVSREDAAELWHLLEDGNYHKAKSLPIADRMVRAICQEYPRFFISTQDGYKRLDKAGDNEIDAAVADLRSRVWHLLNRIRGHEKAQRDRLQGEL